jgi:hypothetical protein
MDTALQTLASEYAAVPMLFKPRTSLADTLHCVHYCFMQVRWLLHGCSAVCELALQTARACGALCGEKVSFSNDVGARSSSALRVHRFRGSASQRFLMSCGSAHCTGTESHQTQTTLSGGLSSETRVMAGLPVIL